MKYCIHVQLYMYWNLLMKTDCMEPDLDKRAETRGSDPVGGAERYSVKNCCNEGDNASYPRQYVASFR